MSGVIDLSKLPAPNIIEPLDFQSIFDEMINDLKARLDEFDALVESEPIWKLLEVAAYRELMLRARINDACQSVMLAYAQDSNLDQIAALFGVVRQQIDPGNSNAIPPVDPSFESDDRLRQRIQLSLEGHSSAGAIGSYRFHALGASVEVKDVDVASFEPGRVVVTILSTQGSGEPSDALIALARIFHGPFHARRGLLAVGCVLRASYPRRIIKIRLRNLACAALPINQNAHAGRIQSVIFRPPSMLPYPLS